MRITVDEIGLFAMTLLYFALEETARLLKEVVAQGMYEGTALQARFS